MARALLVLALLLVATACGARHTKVAVPAPPKRAFAGGALTPPRAAPALSLRDAAGRRFTLGARRGRFVLVTFLYTHCPDVCPLIASNLNTALRTLGPRGRVDVLAVSVDPARDTPSAVRAYEQRMHLTSHFHFLLGTRAELRRVWAAWHVLAVSRRPGLVDHVAYTALVDTRGRERTLYDAQVTAQQVLHDLRLLESRPA